ncbi:MAG: c-type cytochrome [Candidatus Nitrospinota bacterium M3_3B_026]
MRIPKLAQALLITVGVYTALVILFTHVLHEPIPASVMKMYMFFVVAGVLAVYTSSAESAAELAAPINSLLFDGRLRIMRNIVFVILPPVAAAGAYWLTKPTLEAPVELRTVHPAPPSSLQAFGKTFNLITLENPYRKLEKEDPEKFRRAVLEGRDVYYKNCFFCHGDKLAGKGHYAVGFNNPLPANFQDVGTIAQLQESFLFWRISTGGPGLPNEGAPWASPMPVWQNYLTEDEVWKVILFLYDYTGHAPRVMKEGHE